MAGPILGATGSVVWSNGTTGTNNTLLSSNGVTGGNPVRWTLRPNADKFNTTAFTTTDPTTTFLKGLTSWLGEFEAMIPGPEIGSGGLVTFSAGYVTNLQEWSLDISRPALETTVFGATAKTFLPGLYSWSGRFAGLLDDTTAATMVANSSEPASATFKYSERGVSDATLSGSIFTDNLDIGSMPEALNTIAYTFQGSGALTHSTPTTGNSILTAGSAITADDAGSIVLTASTGRTYTGSAFWTGISIDVKCTELMKVRVQFQGTGALSIA